MKMNLLKEAQSAFDFATYFPLLYKATTDSDSITPGYTYEEINKISFLSHQHRTHLLDFLLSKLLVSGWSGKQKVVRVLLHLCRGGHFEMRILLRQRDGELRKAASLGGPPDPVLDNTPQLFFNSAVQELLALIFDPAIMKSDEVAMACGEEENSKHESALGEGYGATAAYGKYEGFGSTPINKPESIVDQMREIVGKVVLPSEARRNEGLEHLLVGDKGNYQPLHLSNLVPPIETSVAVASNYPSSGPLSYSSISSTRVKGHIAGKAEGGWEDEEEEVSALEEIMPKESVIPVIPSLKTHSMEEEFLWKVMETHSSWPVHMENFVSMCRESAAFDVEDFMSIIAKEVCNLYGKIDKKSSDKLSIIDKKGRDFSVTGSFEGIKTKASNSKGLETSECSVDDSKNVEGCRIKHLDPNNALLLLLLLIEYGIYEDIYSIHVIHSHLESSLKELAQSKSVNLQVKLKAKKLYLMLLKLKSYTL